MKAIEFSDILQISKLLTQTWCLHSEYFLSSTLLNWFLQYTNNNKKEILSQTITKYLKLFTKDVTSFASECLHDFVEMSFRGRMSLKNT